MQKITRKSIFSNLLKLVFITLFVGVFSQIFGTNNSLTWVCVLIGTMMFCVKNLYCFFHKKSYCLEGHYVSSAT